MDILSAISILAIIASIAIGFLRRFSLTNALIVGNLAVFLFIIASFSQFGGFSLSPVQEELGFRPSYLVTGESLYTVFTQMFVHATIAHVIVNILFLFLIGSHLESRIGKPRFAAVYFIAGLAGALAESMIQWGSPILIVGASGAISGAMGAMLLLYPKDEVPMFLGPLFLPRVPVWLSVGSWFAIQVVMVFLDSGPVAYTAHLGGFLTGMIVAQLFSLRPTKEVRPSAASYESLESFAMTSELKEALTVIKEEKFEDVRRAWLEHFAKKARCPKCGSTPQLKGDRLVCRCGFEGGMMPNRIELLCAGRIRKEGGIVLEAHSSSTLILTDDLKVVVDTGSSELRGTIIKSLERLGVEPEEVGIVIITHLHHDHCANNDLFREAELVAHAAEDPGRRYKTVGETELSPGVGIVHTPGHSRGSISVFVEAELRYAVCGDALPTKDNYLKWVPPGLNYDPVLSLGSMRRIVEFADIVIPGHDAPFRIDR